jgi:hypothetical protein
MKTAYCICTAFIVLAACLSKQWALAVCTLATAPGFWFLCMKEEK